MPGSVPLFLLHRHVQYKNPIRNYYSNQDVAARYIQKLITSVEKAEESCSRRRNKTLSHKLTIRLLFLIFTTRKLTVETFWDVKNSAWGKYLLKLLSIRFTFKSNFKLSCFLVESSCFAVNLFVLRGEIASGNVSKRWSKISPWIWTPFPIQGRTRGCY